LNGGCRTRHDRLAVSAGEVASWHGGIKDLN
jgi:hypothetical protein